MSHRARVLALFQLGVTGGAPLGALVIGYLAAALGPRRVTLVPAFAMWLVLALTARRSPLAAARPPVTRVAAGEAGRSPWAREARPPGSRLSP